VFRLHRGATKLETLVKAVRETLTPNYPLHLQGKVETQKSTAPPHADDQVAMYSRYGVVGVEAGATRTPGSP